MKKSIIILIYFLIPLAIVMNSCRQSYEPDVIKANKNFLVVDGIINMSANGVTSIKLSRTRNVTDSVIQFAPEEGAAVSIVSKSGQAYYLYEDSTGTYLSQPLNLSINDEYALQIVIRGSTYLSDYTTPKATPPVDSLEWIYTPGSGVSIFANTHDPQNKTRYYRWDFTETWQYRSALKSELGIGADGLIYYFEDEPQNQLYDCWHTTNSTNIMLGTSAALVQDVISHDSITHIPQRDLKIVVRYSLLLRQYALDTASYQYWQLLQKNTQQLGTLFDPQPTQLTGNIHNTANALEPVLGYVTASTIEEKRLFIEYSQVPNWSEGVVADPECGIAFIAQNSNFRVYDYPDPDYGPYYFTSPSGLAIAKKRCLDCTLQGGTNQKPSFW